MASIYFIFAQSNHVLWRCSALAMVYTFLELRRFWAGFWPFCMKQTGQKRAQKPSSSKIWSLFEVQGIPPRLWRRFRFGLRLIKLVRTNEIFWYLFNNVGVQLDGVQLDGEFNFLISINNCWSTIRYGEFIMLEYN